MTDIEHSPVVAFGSTALAVALRAKTGRCSLRDQVRLAAEALRRVPGDEVAAAAVVAFLDAVNIDQRSAGMRLQAFLDDWLDLVCPRRAESLKRKADLFAWQGRTDCGHD